MNRATLRLGVPTVVGRGRLMSIHLRDSSSASVISVVQNPWLIWDSNLGQDIYFSGREPISNIRKIYTVPNNPLSPITRIAKNQEAGPETNPRAACYDTWSTIPIFTRGEISFSLYRVSGTKKICQYLPTIKKAWGSKPHALVPFHKGSR
jgi:hypothetical protein